MVLKGSYTWSGCGVRIHLAIDVKYYFIFPRLKLPSAKDTFERIDDLSITYQDGLLLFDRRMSSRNHTNENITFYSM